MLFHQLQAMIEEDWVNPPQLKPYVPLDQSKLEKTMCWANGHAAALEPRPWVAKGGFRDSPASTRSAPGISDRPAATSTKSAPKSPSSPVHDADGHAGAKQQQWWSTEDKVTPKPCVAKGNGNNRRPATSWSPPVTKQRPVPDPCGRAKAKPVSQQCGADQQVKGMKEMATQQAQGPKVALGRRYRRPKRFEPTLNTIFERRTRVYPVWSWGAAGV